MEPLLGTMLSTGFRDGGTEVLQIKNTVLNRVLLARSVTVPPRTYLGIPNMWPTPAVLWENPRVQIQLSRHGRSPSAAQTYTQDSTVLTAKIMCPSKVGSCRLQLCLSAFWLLQLGTAKAGGGCPPLAAHPLFISLRGWREITLNTEAGIWRQLLVIDSTKYETACTSSMKHGISSILLVGEMNGARDNLGKLGIC